MKRMAHLVGNHEDFFDYVGRYHVGEGSFLLFRYPWQETGTWHFVLKGESRFHDLPVTWIFT